MWPYNWPWSTSAVPPGTCLVHGSFAGPFCPTCSTAATIPGLNKPMPLTIRDLSPLGGGPNPLDRHAR